MKSGKHRGTETELRACAWLLAEGYEVFRNVSPFGPIDIVAIKAGIVRFIDVKTRTGTRSGHPADNDGIEVLCGLPDGGFKFRKKRSKFLTREPTPREIVLRKLDPHQNLTLTAKT